MNTAKIIKPYIERAVIELNGGCNYSCAMCPQTNPGRSKNFLKKMPLEQFKDIVTQCTERGVKVVNLEGSGEATLVRNLHEYIQVCTDLGIDAYVFSNGYRFKGDFMKKCIDAGLKRFRFSIIGYSRDSYIEWMNRDAFEEVKQNAIEAIKYVKSTGSECKITSYHLITSNSQLEFELDEYKKNWIEPTGCLAEVWKMHNWSGVFDNPNERTGGKKTCGRPFAPEIIIRAGGLNGETGAVHPCCQVLGRDDEAVLGHFSESSFDEIWNGELYQELRQNHLDEEYPSYCQGCDFLVDDPEVLVWTNHDRDVHKIVGTTFSLDEYR